MNKIRLISFVAMMGAMFAFTACGGGAQNAENAAEETTDVEVVAEEAAEEAPCENAGDCDKENCENAGENAAEGAETPAEETAEVPEQ